MTYVVSFAGQKGGTGKSMLAQAYAAEAVRKKVKTVLVDLDVGQRSSFEWSQTRLTNEIKPHIQVAVIDPSKHAQDFGILHAGKGVDLLIVDAPGWSDEKTKLLAGFSDLMVLPTGASVADMRPTIRLMHELTAKGISKDQICTALCRAKSVGEIKFARQYINQAGYEMLPGILRDMPTYRSLQNEGRAATEADSKNIRDEARNLIGEIDKALKVVRDRSREKPERFEMQPERYVHNDGSKTKTRTRAKSRGRSR